MANRTTNEKDRQKLKAELEAATGVLSLRIRAYLERAKSYAVIAEVEAALQSGNQTLAMTILNNQIDALKPSITEIFTQVGQSAAVHNQETVAASLGTEAAAGGAGGAGGAVGAASGGGEFLGQIGIVFDPTNPRAVEAIRNETQFFIREITDTQTELIRDVLADAYQNGWGPRKTAAALRDDIGLTKYQRGIVERYEESLRKSSAQALNYVMRNQARDARVIDAMHGGKPLSEKEIQRLVDQFRRNAIGRRVETIARTEGTRVTNMARQESFLQMATGARIGSNRMVRVWHATEDDRTRDWHASMDGQTRGLTTPFEDGLGNDLMYPGDPDAPADTVINCRCSMTVQISE